MVVRRNGRVLVVPKREARRREESSRSKGEAGVIFCCVGTTGLTNILDMSPSYASMK